MLSEEISMKFDGLDFTLSISGKHCEIIVNTCHYSYVHITAIRYERTIILKYYGDVSFHISLLFLNEMKIVVLY